MPCPFLFDVREPSATLRAVSESAMRKVVGDHTVDEVITIVLIGVLAAFGVIAYILRARSTARPTGGIRPTLDSRPVGAGGRYVA